MRKTNYSCNSWNNKANRCVNFTFLKKIYLVDLNISVLQCTYVICRGKVGNLPPLPPNLVLSNKNSMRLFLNSR